MWGKKSGLSWAFQQVNSTYNNSVYNKPAMITWTSVQVGFTRSVQGENLSIDSFLRA
jgi:hypothetical protein